MRAAECWILVRGRHLLTRFICCVAAVAIAAAPLVADASCFTKSEWEAAHVRILELELNVAQLECANVVGANYDKQYAAFLDRFKDRLLANTAALKAHFRRVYAGNAEREIDIFMTKLANDASARSMNDMKFCANSAASFQTALSIDKPQLEQTAVAHVTDHTEVGEECPVVEAPAKAKPKVMQAAAKVPASPKAATASPAAVVTPVAVPAAIVTPVVAPPPAAPTAPASAAKAG